MSVMGFQKKKKFGWGWVGGWGELHSSLFWIFGIFLTLQSTLGGYTRLKCRSCSNKTSQQCPYFTLYHGVVAATENDLDNNNNNHFIHTLDFEVKLRSVVFTVNAIQ